MFIVDMYYLLLMLLVCVFVIRSRCSCRFIFYLFACCGVPFVCAFVHVGVFTLFICLFYVRCFRLVVFVVLSCFVIFVCVFLDVFISFIC